jgi:hypothetical protein
MRKRGMYRIKKNLEIYIIMNFSIIQNIKKVNC